MQRLLSLALPAVLVACGAQPDSRSTNTSALTSDGRYIVGANGSFSSDFASRVAALGGTVESQHDGAGIAVVSGISDPSRLAALPGVSDVEADDTVTLDTPVAPAEADSSSDVTVESVGNPAGAALFSWQWNMRDINAPAAWAAGHLGDASVTAAILDTGIDYDSRDLNGLVDLSRSRSFIPSDNAIISSLFPGRNPVTDLHGHGTNVASQVSSKGGIFAGVTSKTTLIAVKVLSAKGSGSFSGVLNGLLWAVDNGADVANMSLGGGFFKAHNGKLVGLINKTFNFTRAHGMLTVVAAGNSSIDLDHDQNFYAAFCNTPAVVCVSAVGLPTWTGNPDTPSFFTNFGRSAIDVAGPGGNASFDAAGNLLVTPGWPWSPAGDIASWVWSFCSKNRVHFDPTTGVPSKTVCAAGNRLLGFIGTSQATPHVAGLASLLVAEQGHGDPAQIRAAIEQSADQVGGNGTSPFFGKGRIDVGHAVGL